MSFLRSAGTPRFGSLIIVAAIGLGVAVVPTVSAADGPELLKGANVVEIPRERPLEFKRGTNRRELVQGKSEKGTCRFSIAFHSEGDDTTPQMAAMIALNPDSCEAEIERGVPATLPRVDQPLDEGGGQKTVIVENGKRGDAATLADDVGDEGQTKKRKATFWYIYEDPPGFATNRVRTSVRTKVKKRQIDSAKCTYYWSKLNVTGWKRDLEYHDSDCKATPKKATSVDSEHFYTDEFLGPLCSGRERTHTYYFRVTSELTRNDSDGYVDVTWAQGGCASWLTGVSLWEPGVYYED